MSNWDLCRFRKGRSCHFELLIKEEHMYGMRESGPSVMNGPYEGLANAIIIQAARDYRLALRKVSRNKNNQDAIHEIESIERFFHSNWFGILTSIEPDVLIQRLRQEVR